MARRTGDLLLKGGRVLDPASPSPEPYSADLLIEGGRIAAVLTDPRQERAATETVDVSEMLVLPGFVNAHYHSHDVFLKGCFEPSILERWVLSALPRSYRARSDREVRLRTLLGAVECLRGGITTVQDMLTLAPMSARQANVVAEAYREAGLRAVISPQLADVSPLGTVPFWSEEIPDDLKPILSGARPPPKRDPLEEVRQLVGESCGSLITWGLAPSSPERCTPPLLERIAMLADDLGLRLYSHIYISRAEAVNARRGFAEHGGSLVRYLAAMGVLGPRMTLAHGVWLDDDEIELLARAGTALVTNPLSNLKTKNGVAPVRRLLNAGVRLGIGCDNCSCSDAQNIFQGMKLFCLLAAVSDPAEGRPYAIDALRAATSEGAHALGLGERVGAIRPGMSADLTVLDLSDPVYVPLNNAVRQVVYGEGGRGVDTVVVEGRVVVRKGRVVSVDAEALLQEVESVCPDFLREAREVIANTERLKPHITRADKKIWAVPLGLQRFVGDH